MRALIFILSLLFVLVLTNIVLYTTSDDYRFFIKKIKYGNQPVVSEQILDVQEVIQLQDTVDGDIDQVLDMVSKRQKGMTFLEILEENKKNTPLDDDTLPELTFYEQKVVEIFQENFDIVELLIQTRLFGVTREYPDNYYEYYGEDITLYVFPTKNYRDIFKIFDVVKDEEKIFLNETNTIADKTFFINLSEDYTINDEIRLVFEYEKRAFGLKIKKDSYNRVKDILEKL